MKGFFVTGIGTDVGKTIVAAILTEALQADYWKPVQTGNQDLTDTGRVRNLVSNSRSVFHLEAYSLVAPLSPHAAAANESVTIDITQINLPETANTLIVEGAGGLLVPLNNNYLIIDLIQKLGLPVVLVSANYLGSINHTLLSLAELKTRQIPVAGLVFNGEPNPQTEDFILQYSGVRRIFTVLPEKEINPAIIQKYAAQVPAQFKS